jgi:hypothetical protein
MVTEELPGDIDPVRNRATVIDPKEVRRAVADGHLIHLVAGESFLEQIAKQYDLGLERVGCHR